MQSEEEEESDSSLSFSERVHLVVRDLKKFYGYTFAGSVVGLIFAAILIALVTNLFYLLSSYQIPSGREIDREFFMILTPSLSGAWMLSIFVFMGAAVVFFNLHRWGRKAVKELALWDQEYIRLSYLINFESLPLIGKTPQERIFNQLVRSFPELRRTVGEKVKEKPELINQFINYEYKFRKIPVMLSKKYVFDVFIGRQIKKWFSHFGYLMVKRFEQNTPVTKEQVSEVLDIANRLKEDSNLNIYRIICVTTSSFSDEVFGFLDKRGGIRRACDLVVEEKSGYVLARMDRSKEVQHKFYRFNIAS